MLLNSVKVHKRSIPFLFIIFTLLFSVPLQSYGESVTHDWSKRIGGSGYDYGYGVAADTSGNVFITGNVEGTSDFNGDGDTSDTRETTASPYGGYDFFVSAFDEDGTNLWYKRLGGSDDDSGNGIHTDSSGNVYVIGYVYGTGDLNGDGDTGDTSETTGAPYGGNDAVISAFDGDGNNLWYKRFGGSSSDNGLGVATDSSGNVYVVGNVGGTADLNADGDTSDTRETTGAPYSGSDAFVSVFDENGTNLWYKRFGGTGTDLGSFIAVDTSSNVYVVSRISGTGDLNGDGDTGDTSETTGAPYGGNDAVISAFDENGTNLWYKRLGGSGSDAFGGVTTDNLSNVYVTGQVNGTGDLNGDADTSDTRETTAAPYGDVDAFISVFNSSGTNLWYKRLGGSGYDFGSAIFRGSSDKIYTAITVAETGDLNGDADTSDTSETTASPYGSDDAVITVFDDDGNSLWYKRLGGTDFDYGYGITADSSGGVYLTGVVPGTADFNGDGDTVDTVETQASPYGVDDIFITVFLYDFLSPTFALNSMISPIDDPLLTGTATDVLGVVSSVQFQIDGTGGAWTTCDPDDGTFDEASELFICQLGHPASGSHTVYVRSTDSGANTTSGGSEASSVFEVIADSSSREKPFRPEFEYLDPASPYHLFTATNTIQDLTKEQLVTSLQNQITELMKKLIELLTKEMLNL